MEVNCIVSLTSHHERLKHVYKTIDCILGGRYTPKKIVLTIYRDDEVNIPNDLYNKCEVIVADNNLRSHLKYFYAMQRYPDVPIITIDDDCRYPGDFVELLWKSYIEFPNYISAYRVHKPTFSNKKMKHYQDWIRDYKTNNPSGLLMPTGVGGVLYPPNILNIGDGDIETIKKYITTDDIFLFYKELKNHIIIRYVPHPNKFVVDQTPEVFNLGLCLQNEANGCEKHNFCIDELINKNFNFN